MNPAALSRVDARDRASVIEALHVDGVVIVRSLLDPAVVAQVNREVQPELDRQQAGNTKINDTVDLFFGPAVRHLSALATHSPTFANEVMAHPLLRAVCDDLLLPNCASYIVNLAHLMERGPGAEPQLVHRDQLVWPHLKIDGEIQVATIVALVDFTQENGATGVVPGSHRWDDPSRKPEQHEIAYADIAAGDAVVYLGSTLHFGGGNTTADQWRRGVHLSYALGWLRTEENNYLATPPSVARNLSREAQELLGYATHDAIAIGGGYLGMVNMQNPIDLLATNGDLA